MFLYAIVPVIVLVHELGHAAAAIRAGKRPLVFVGITPAMFVWRFKRLDLLVHPRMPVAYFYPLSQPSQIPKMTLGLCKHDRRGLTVGQLRSILSAGPHAAIILGLAAGVAAWLIPTDSLLFWIAAWTAVGGLLDGLGNLYPFRADNRHFSDGFKMARLRGIPDHLVLPTGRQPAP